jgi:putative ABC transport system permease protein
MTLEKTPQIALLKLIGARDRVIVSMIVTQSVLIGLLGLVIGIFIALNLFPHFPRIVLITFVDVVSVALALIILSIFASWFSIQKALNVRAQAILS